MIGIVTGLTAEARCFARIPRGGLVCCAGPGPTQAARAAEMLVQRGITGLVSFGLAGGLTPALRPGTVVLANTVVVQTVAGPTLFFPDTPWRERLQARLAPLAPRVAPLAASDHIISQVLDKARLAAITGAEVVDMESGSIVKCAASFKIPVLIVRVTADPAERTLPPAVLSSVDTNGDIRPLRVLRTLARQPAQCFSFIRVLSDSYIAFKVLHRVARQAGADCAFLP